MRVNTSFVAILLGIARQIAISGQARFRNLCADNNLQSVRQHRAILTRFRYSPYSSLRYFILESLRQDGKMIRGRAAAVQHRF